MAYMRRTICLLSAGIVMSMTSAALAQDEPQTLDEQMEQHMQAQQPSHLPPSVPADAIREWPGEPSLATGPENGDEDYGVIDSEGSGAIPALPLEVQSMNGVTYLTGGIGDEEVEQLKASEHQYNLHLLMTSERGAFISDVDVNITDASGHTIVSAPGSGPYFYALLPQGKYTVQLSEGSQSKTFKVNIGTNSNVRKTAQFKEPGGVITPHTPTQTVE